MVASKRLPCTCSRIFVRGNVLNVGLAGVQLVDFELIGIKSGDDLAHVGKAQRQWQAHVAASDNPNL